MLSSDQGSFRDPANRVYVYKSDSDTKNIGTEIYRGINQETLDDYRLLSDQTFFKELVLDHKIVVTHECSEGVVYEDILADGWAGVLKHETIPFVTYPYEWTFSMLKDAALLHLEIIEQSLENGWTLKDATPYNIQWVNAKPVFIDIPSFKPWKEGTPWLGYRQFCSLFLTPLLLRAHLSIEHEPLLRSYLDGIPPSQAAKYFQGRSKFRKGVMSHIVLPAKVESSILKKERDGAVATKRTGSKHSKAMVVGLAQSLSRLIRGLKSNIEHTDWSHYDRTHSYAEEEHAKKKRFVEKNAKRKHRRLSWDIGCNTGTFSKIIEPYADHIVSIDGDHDAVEQLYLREKLSESGKVLPLVMNLANISPDQGWAGKERAALDKRNKPDFVLVLALIHHTRISSNIPNAMFLKWLHELGSDVIIEFVTRTDEMVVKLLTNKEEQYKDYNLEQFVSECEELYSIEDRITLKGGKRELFYLKPKNNHGS